MLILLLSNYNNNETIFGFNSLLYNLSYKISSNKSSILFKFIDLYIKSNPEYIKDQNLKNILINFDSNPIYYSRKFLEIYKNKFLNF